MIGAVINIVLDPVFIFVLNMGVKGAAIATIIAQFVSATWVLLFLCGKRAPVRLTFKSLKPDFRLIGKIMAGAWCDGLLLRADKQRCINVQQRKATAAGR